mmetsp:Transcript_16405/g.40438  ORF Transcript_16405/g.40438 Transcript_16405/m.40438 type:complete len:576 (+) Transcript_16405:161-1888(+)|eukprot:CAMPEP_0114521084 /NCGR_PEP_ID=MMETSP0109-20121206/19986_1 /TAXON_ID=29199 /ORGANISM="Chlorarachnion reptans, Strain CCCM449" /LENGTH=575 /DNA_ID=CAMNT_0001702143 /DNA_START=83 /DNA_END=1810 /DNA_ORIENTATION=-
MEAQLTHFEAEAYAKMIEPFAVEDIGSKSWMRQHNLVEQLNIQAHNNAVTKHDEFVVEALLDAEKLPTLIHHLLATEAWKIKIYPRLYKKIKAAASVKAYIALYHEATVCNLLEVLLYHEQICESGGDAMCELADYCYRKLLMLSTKRVKPPEPKPKGKVDLKAMANEKAHETLEKQARDIEYTVCMSCITLMRFLTEHIKILPVSVPRQLLDNLDVPMVLVPLMEAAPWQRRTREGIEKYVENKWMKIERKDRFRLSKLEAQVWLSIYNLLMDKGCRSLYDFTNYRKDVLCRLKRYLNDLLKDQLPMLLEMQRFLEELSLMKIPAEPKPLHLVVPVERIRELVYNVRGPDGKMDERTDEHWNLMAKKQLEIHFTMDHKSTMEQMKTLAELYGGGAMEALTEDPKCARCGKPATNRCSNCRQEWYCGRKCQLKAWKKHKKVCALLTEAFQKKEPSKETKGGDEKAKGQPKNITSDAGNINAQNKIVDITKTKKVSNSSEEKVSNSSEEKITELVASSPSPAPRIEIPERRRSTEAVDAEEKPKVVGPIETSPKPTQNDEMFGSANDALLDLEEIE